MRFPGAGTGFAVGECYPRRAYRAAEGHAVIATWLLALVLSVAVVEPLLTERSPPSASARPRALLRAHRSELPVALQELASAALAADAGAFRVKAAGGGFDAYNVTQALRMRFAATGVEISAGTTRLGLHLQALGYGSSLRALASSPPHAHANRVTYTHAALSESYSNGPLGLEQGFTIAHAPSRVGEGPLTLSIAMSGDTRVSLAGDRLSLIMRHAGGPSLRYAGLFASDARGHALRSWLALRGRRLLLRVDTRGARFPLQIDPLIQQGEKLTGSGEIGEGLFGTSAALSSDGNTALIGAPFDDGDVGAAWVFTRAGATWAQQGEKLTAGGESGRASFGASVALSSGGETALIGGPADSAGAGAAWVFTRTGATWTQQGEKLGGGAQNANGGFGSSVALSSEGSTALIGAPFNDDERGAAWTFTRTGASWSQQGEALTGSGENGAGEFGSSVALSCDATTALIGGEGDDGGIGAAWVFTRTNAEWSQQGEKLTGAGELGAGKLGYAAALSCEGDTALIGAEADDGGIGAAWVFTRTNASWSQQGEKLTGSTGVDKGFFGFSVALSASGDTALIGGQDTNDIGAVWVFTRSGDAWRNREQLVRSGEVGYGAFGQSVALSSDGETALVGGPGDSEFIGAAWVFTNVQTPAVKRLHRHSGPATGGTQVTLTGANLLGATAVDFGSTSAASFAIDSATSITAITPAEPAGHVDVTVTTANGTSAIEGQDRYVFTPSVTGVSPSGAAVAGATSVMVTGSGFLPGNGATAFRFGSARATAVSCASSTSCVVLAPAHPAGMVNVRARVNSVKSPPNAPADLFGYS